MEQTINTIIKYLQQKTTSFSVSEINEISQMLTTLIPKPPENPEQGVGEVSTPKKK